MASRREDLRDPALTDLGRLQASSVAQVYPQLYKLVKDRKARVMTSPFIRALLTTHLAFPFLAPDEVLKEPDLCVPHLYS